MGRINRRNTLAKREATLEAVRRSVEIAVSTVPLDTNSSLQILEDRLEELGAAIKTAARSLPLAARNRLRRVYRRYIETGCSFAVVCHVARRDLEETFWNGVAQALLTAERSDLLAEFPEADRAAARIEATELLKRKKPPAS